MSRNEIKVPNIGDFKDVEVIEVLVSEGQILKKNDPVITIESDKSSVEIPSNFDGKIKTLKIKVGDKVSEGDLILILENTSQTQEKIKKEPIVERELKKIQVIKPEIQQTATIKIKLQIFHLQVQKFENLHENLVWILIKFKVVNEKVGLLKVI